MRPGAHRSEQSKPSGDHGSHRLTPDRLAGGFGAFRFQSFNQLDDTFCMRTAYVRSNIGRPQRPVPDAPGVGTGYLVWFS